MRDVLAALAARRAYVAGVNYWVGAGGLGDLTRLFDAVPDAPRYARRPAADVVAAFFRAPTPGRNAGR